MSRYDASYTDPATKHTAYEDAYAAGHYGHDEQRPPLPYTQSELELEDHPATRTPDFYANTSPPTRRPSSSDDYDDDATLSASHSIPSAPSAATTSRGRASHASRACSSSDATGRTWEERRVRARERQARGRARAAAEAAAAAAAAGGRAEPGERDLCCGVVGPWRPFWGRQSHADVATSHVLPPRAFVVWRLVLFGVAAAALAMTAVRDRYSLRGTQLIALVFAVYIPLRLAYVTYRYMGMKGEGEEEAALHTPSTALAHIVLLYQGNLVLLLFSPISLWLTLQSEPSRDDLNGFLYSGRADIFIPVASLLILFIIDMFFAALDFRLTYILPTVVYGAIFMALSIYRYGKFDRPMYLGVSVGLLLAISLVVLLVGRGLNLLVRRQSVLARRSAEINAIETSPSPDGEPVDLDEEPPSASYDLEGARRTSAF